MILLEVCSNSVHSALSAQEAGAYRVELCNNLSEGGTTPSPGQIKLARRLLNIKLNVLIRPRGGDFLYDDLDFDIMKEDIRMCGQIGCDGVVVGILHADGNIDIDRTRSLVEIAREYNMSVTFHRAFDHCKDLFSGLEDVIRTGCDRILTSGGKNSALLGAETLRRLIEQAGSRIIILPGAGINDKNIADLVRVTGLSEFHGSFSEVFPNEMKYFNLEMSDVDEYKKRVYTNKDKVKNAIKNANEAST